MSLPLPAAALRLGGRHFPPGQLLVMAVLDPPGEHPSGGSQHPAASRARLDGATAAGQAAAEGADIVEICGVPAVPGPEVTADEELERVVPLIDRLRVEQPQLLLSVATSRSQVAAAACAAGADLIHDTCSGSDPSLPEVAARSGAGLVCSHTGGSLPGAIPYRVTYGHEPEDVVDEVIGALLGAAGRAAAAGVPKDSILLAPALGAGKNTWHGLALLRRLDALATLGHPILMSISRTALIGETLGLADEELLEGTLAATALSAWLGAKVFRVHDVQATRRTLDMISAIRGDRPPASPLRGLE